MQIGKVTFFPNDKGELPNLVRDDTFNDPNKLIPENLNGTDCYATILPIEGTSDYAIGSTIEKIKNAIHIINLYMVACRDRDEKICKKIGVIGETLNFNRRFILLHSTRLPNEEIETSYPPRVSMFNTQSYKIYEQTVEHWKSRGFDEIVKCFDDKSSKGISLRIRNAVIWYSKAVTFNEQSEQVVGLAVALESLLGDESTKSDLKAQWGSISQKLADRVAFLLGKDYEQRVELTKQVIRLYSERSEVVHSGIPVPAKEIDKWNDIVQSTIIEFVAKEFSSWDEFQDWERRQKYG